MRIYGRIIIFEFLVVVHSREWITASYQANQTVHCLCQFCRHIESFYLFVMGRPGRSNVRYMPDLQKLNAYSRIASADLINELKDSTLVQIDFRGSGWVQDNVVVVLGKC